ncbi:MAG: hypothetical protein HY808_15640 [Nitrospirae bacterium]|nr:hypothetical protein [Nitrospirota bacterium]
MKKHFFGFLAVLLLFGCATDRQKIQTVFYPMPPQNPKLQFLMSISTEEDLGKKKDVLMEFLVGQTIAQKQVARAVGITTAKGKIYVSDRTFKKILILDLDKKEFDYIKDEKEGQISSPGGIWVTEDGYKYIADLTRKQILVFDAQNNYVKAYGSEEQFAKPMDVVVYENKIYVCDFDKHQIIILDRDSGKVVQTIGEAGSEEGKLYKPSHIVIDKYGSIYVNDSFNFRVQKFDSLGKFEKTFGYQGDTLGGFARPKGISVDDEGYLYVVDTAFENVQIFDGETTRLVLFFGGFGPEPGSMYMPNSIHIDYQNIDYFKKYIDKDFKVKYLVFVGNMLGEHKINVYGFGDWTGAPLPGITPQKIN